MHASLEKECALFWQYVLTAGAPGGRAPPCLEVAPHLAVRLTLARDRARWDT